MANVSSWSTEGTSGRTSDVTPQHNVSARAVCSVAVKARIIAPGRRLLRAIAVRPEAVATTITGAFNCSAARQAASTIASVIGCTKAAREAGVLEVGPR